MAVDTTAMPSSTNLAVVPRQVLTRPPPTPTGELKLTAANPEGAKKGKKSWRREYNRAAEEGARDYQPGDDDPDDSGNEGSDGSDCESEDDPEDDFEPGPVVEGTRVKKGATGHVLGSSEGVRWFPELPKLPPQLPEPEGVNARPEGQQPSPSNGNGNSSSSGDYGAPSSAAVVPRAGEFKFGSTSNQSVKQFRTNEVADRALTFFDSQLAQGQGFFNTIKAMTVFQAPEVADGAWVVPAEPSPGSADMHLIKANTEKRELERICMRILAETRKLRRPFIELCIARNKHRRITEATATRESARDRTQALEQQLRQARRDHKLKHLREDRQL